MWGDFLDYTVNNFSYLKSPYIMCHTRIPGVVENIISFNPSIFYTLFSLQGIEDSAKGKKKLFLCQCTCIIKLFNIHPTDPGRVMGGQWPSSSSLGEKLGYAKMKHEDKHTAFINYKEVPERHRETLGKKTLLHALEWITYSRCCMFIHLLMDKPERYIISINLSAYADG